MSRRCSATWSFNWARRVISRAKVTTRRNLPAGKHQLLAVAEVLGVGGRLAGAHDFRVQDKVKNALFLKFAHVLAAHAFLAQPGELLVHPVDAQRGANRIGDEHPVGQGIKNIFEISAKLVHTVTSPAPPHVRKPPRDGAKRGTAINAVSAPCRPKSQWPPVADRA